MGAGCVPLALLWLSHSERQWVDAVSMVTLSLLDGCPFKTVGVKYRAQKNQRGTVQGQECSTELQPGPCGCSWLQMGNKARGIMLLWHSACTQTVAQCMSSLTSWMKP